MITLRTRLHVEDGCAREILGVLVDPDDATYRSWWPGTHLAFHVVRRGRGPDHLGDVVHLDERVGRRRLRMTAVVEEFVPGDRVTWRMRCWSVPLPVRVRIATHPDSRGLAVCHTLTIGWPGWRRHLDPVWRRALPSTFDRDLDRHVRTEIALLGVLLRARHRT